MAQITLRFTITNATSSVATTGEIKPIVGNQLGKSLGRLVVTDTHENTFTVPGPGYYTYAFLIIGSGNFNMSCVRQDTNTTCGSGAFSASGPTDHLNIDATP